MGCIEVFLILASINSRLRASKIFTRVNISKIVPWKWNELIIPIPKSSAILGQYFSCQLISTIRITLYANFSSRMMLIILMFASPPFPYSPTSPPGRG